MEDEVGSRIGELASILQCAACLFCIICLRPLFSAYLYSIMFSIALDLEIAGIPPAIPSKSLGLEWMNSFHLGLFNPSTSPTRFSNASIIIPAT